MDIQRQIIDKEAPLTWCQARLKTSCKKALLSVAGQRLATIDVNTMRRRDIESLKDDDHNSALATETLQVGLRMIIALNFLSFSMFLLLKIISTILCSRSITVLMNCPL